MTANELIKILKEIPDDTEIVVSIFVEKELYSYDIYRDVRIFNECRDITKAELTTEYYRCLRYNDKPIPVLKLEIDEKNPIKLK